MKEQLKKLAREIREFKSKRKSSPNGYVRGLGRSQYIYRHKHIAYCLLRGRVMEQIEPKNRPGNKPNMDLVNSYMGVDDEKQTTRLAS